LREAVLQLEAAPAMPTIEFEGAGIASDKLVDVPEGGDLVDICDRILAPVAFSCRSASCGTCHIRVLEGAALLEPPNEAEADLLDLLDGPADSRLACQARVRPGPGKLRVRPVTP
jgi:ferredoxin